MATGNQWTVLLREAERLEGVGQRAKAIEVARQAIEQAQAELAPTDLRLASAYHTLSTILVEPVEIAAALSREVEILDRNPPSDGSEMIRPLGALYKALLAGKQFDEARPVMNRIIQVIDRYYGPDSEQLGLELLIMGDFLKYGQRLDEAVGLYRQALALFEKRGGSPHPHVADVLERIADALTTLSGTQ